MTKMISLMMMFFLHDDVDAVEITGSVSNLPDEVIMVIFSTMMFFDQDGKIGARCSDSGARETQDGCR